MSWSRACRRALIPLFSTALVLGLSTPAAHAVVTKDATHLEMSCSPDTNMYSGSLSYCTFTVTDTTTPSSVPTGGIADSFGPLNFGELDSHGVAVQPIGSNDFGLYYSGDATHDQSNTVDIDFYQDRHTRTTLACPYSIGAGVPLKCSVSVTDVSASDDKTFSPETFVTLTDDDDPDVHSTCALPFSYSDSSTCTFSFHEENNPGTTHHLTATYDGQANPGDSGYLPSTGTTTIDVGPLGNAVAGLQVVAPASPTHPGVDDIDVTLTPTANTPVPTGVIDLFDHGVKFTGFTLDSAGKATLADAQISVGDHQFTIDYRGDTNYARHLYGPLPYTVNSWKTATRLTGRSGTVPAHTPVTFVAHVKTRGPGVDGVVDFFDNGHAAGERSVVNGIARWTTEFSKVGDHAVTAHYAGDSPGDPEGSRFAESDATTAPTVTTVPLAKGAARPVGTFVGSTAPNFAGVDQYTNRVSLRSLRGKWVLVEFSALWCPASLYEDAFNASVQRHMNKAGIPFVHLNVEIDGLTPGLPGTRKAAEVDRRSTGDWSPSITAKTYQEQVAYNAIMQQYVDAQAEYGSRPAVPEPEALYPTNVLIAPNGVVRFIFAQGIDGNQLQSIFATTPPMDPAVLARTDADPTLPISATLKLKQMTSGYSNLDAPSRAVLDADADHAAQWLDPVSPYRASRGPFAALGSYRQHVAAATKSGSLTTAQSSALRAQVIRVERMLWGSGVGQPLGASVSLSASASASKGAFTFTSLSKYTKASRSPAASPVHRLIKVAHRSRAASE
jgi:cytochrome oxidase Cu insertion factor (SCO1/SenC/PrrC family)